MRDLPCEGEIYRHFKGNTYRIICIARDSETMEEMVVYGNKEDPSKKFVRPLKMFMSEVDHEKYPDVKQKYRFEKEEPGSTSPAKAETASEGEPSEDLMAYLDAVTYEEKLDVLYKIRPRLTDETVNAIAMSLDTEIREGSIPERYEEIRNYILTMMKYEGARLRP